MAAYTAGFMTHVTCRLTAKTRDQLRNPKLGNRVRGYLYLLFHLMYKNVQKNSGRQKQHGSICWPGRNPSSVRNIALNGESGHRPGQLIDVLARGRHPPRRCWSRAQCGRISVLKIQDRKSTDYTGRCLAEIRGLLSPPLQRRGIPPSSFLISNMLIAVYKIKILCHLLEFSAHFRSLLTV